MRRRDLLGLGVAAGLGALAPGLYAAAAEKRRRVGLIGCGWYGKVDLSRLLQVDPVEVVSLCDVDRQMLEEAADLIAPRQESKKRPRLYRDYREMLKEKDLDIVLVGTPDHWHALPMIEAVQAGADVYVQKPVSVDVVESHAMLAAARKYGRVVQVGTQRRSTPHLQEARDRYVQSGALGKISHVEIYCYYHMRAKGRPEDSAPPETLDYDFWTGPAPMRPFNSTRHPRSWRAFMEYGNGIVGDMCVHMLDAVRWMMDLGWPKRITSSGGILVDKQSIANISDTQTAVFEFENLNVTWQHRSWGAPPDAKYPWGITYYGDKGTLKCGVHSYDYIPLKGDPVHQDVTFELEQYPDDNVFPKVEKHVAPAVRYHMKDFLKAVDARGKPIADIEQGHISTVSCILANLSMDLGRTLVWDPKTASVLNDAEANARLRREYRAPWVHPDPATV